MQKSCATNETETLATTHPVATDNSRCTDQSRLQQFPVAASEPSLIRAAVKQGHAVAKAFGFGDRRKRENSPSVQGNSENAAKVRKVGSPAKSVARHPLKDCSNTSKTPAATAAAPVTWNRHSLCGGAKAMTTEAHSGSSSSRADGSWSGTSSFFTGSTKTSSFFTPNTVRLETSATMKRTPPMCACGRRAQRKIVQSAGPNQGRCFFSCPNGRKSNQSSTVGCFGKKRPTSGCGFFKWEQPMQSPNGTLNSLLCKTNNTMSSSVMSKTNNSCYKSVPNRTYTTPILQPNFNTPQSVSGTTKKTLGVRISQGKATHEGCKTRHGDF